MLFRYDFNCVEATCVSRYFDPFVTIYKMLTCQTDTDSPFTDEAIAYAESLLCRAGARITDKRLKLLILIYGDGSDHRHFMMHDLVEDTKRHNIPISLATFYNTLRMLVDKGLLSEISLPLGQRMFDTDTDCHQHFYNTDSHEIIDIPCSISLENYLPIPDGTEVSNIELTVCIKNK